MRKIRLIENGVKIDGQTFKIGEIIEARGENEKLRFMGRVQFGIYSDGEGCYDIEHLGFSVDNGTEFFTLIDFVNMADEKKWKIIKVKE